MPLTSVPDLTLTSQTVILNITEVDLCVIYLKKCVLPIL